MDMMLLLMLLGGGIAGFSLKGIFGGDDNEETKVDRESGFIDNPDTPEEMEYNLKIKEEERLIEEAEEETQTAEAEASERGIRTGQTLIDVGVGAAAGAAIGSVIPVVGTAVGASIGAMGGWIKSWFN